MWSCDGNYYNFSANVKVLSVLTPKPLDLDYNLSDVSNSQYVSINTIYYYNLLILMNDFTKLTLIRQSKYSF